MFSRSEYCSSDIFTRRVLARCSLPKLSYPERLKFFALDSLETRRVKCDLILMYKIFRGLLDLNVNHFFPTPPARTHSLRSNGLKLQLPYRTNLELIRHSFAFRVRRYWNSLPTLVVAQDTVALFRIELDKYFDAHPIYTQDWCSLYFMWMQFCFSLIIILILILFINYFHLSPPRQCISCGGFHFTTCPICELCWSLLWVRSKETQQQQVPH